MATPKTDNPSKGRIQPEAVRKRALVLYAQGHSTPEIGKAIGVNPSTVRRWCRAAGVGYGSALSDAPAPKNPDEILNPVAEKDETSELLDGLMEQSPAQRLMNADQIVAAIGEALEKPGNAAARYQAVMSALGLNILKTTAMMPPAVKTMRDLATLNEIIRSNLGLNNRSGGGGSLAINLNVLTRAGTAGVTVDAETIEDVEE